MLFFYKNLFLRIVPLSLTLGYFGVDISSAIAQLQPDNTLGEENSVVTPNINIKGIESDRIDGGAQRGANLFHSFQWSCWANTLSLEKCAQKYKDLQGSYSICCSS